MRGGVGRTSVKVETLFAQVGAGFAETNAVRSAARREVVSRRFVKVREKGDPEAVIEVVSVLPDRMRAVYVVVTLNGERETLQIVGALVATSGGPRPQNRRRQEGKR